MRRTTDTGVGSIERDNPWLPEVLMRRAQARKPQRSAYRLAVGRALAQAASELGAGAEAVAAALSLGDPEALAVAAIVPLRLFLGPLAHLYTAWGTLAAARWAQSILGRRVVPVLLLNPGRPVRRGDRAYLVDRGGTLRRVGMVAHREMRLFHQAAAYLIGAVEEMCGCSWPLARNALEGSADLAQWTARLWASYAEGTGLVVARLDSAAWNARLEEALPRVLVRAAAMASLAPSLATGWFRIQNGRRWLSMGWQGGSWGAEGISLDLPALSRWARTHPESFALGHWGTWLALDEVLPLLGAVEGCGPNVPLAAFVSALQDTAGSAPVAWPRPRYTWVTTAQLAFARAHGFSLDAGPTALREARGRSTPGPAWASVQEAQQEVVRALDRWAETVASWVPQAVPAIERRRQALLAELKRAEQEVAAAARREARGTAMAWRQIASMVYPLGRHQDEVLAAGPFLAVWGEWVMPRLLAEPLSEGRRFLRLETAAKV